jgi:hypothetical protein
MKKLILAVLLFVSLGAYSQDLTWSIDPADLTSTDTTIYFSLGHNTAWSFQITYNGIVGTGGQFDVGFSNDTAFTSFGGSLPVVFNASSTSSGVIDNKFGGQLLAFKLTKGSITAGTVVITLNYNR